MPPRSQWIARPIAPKTFITELPPNISPLVGQLLWNRNVNDPSQIEPFLNAEWNTLHDPLAMRGMDRAVARIARAVEQGERVAVYGDFDTDGVTGVALLTQVFRQLGLDVLPYIPRRLDEGYGLNIAAVEQLAREVGLLVTVDCGISNVDEIARAQALGLDIIVLDHHTPPAELPAAHALVNPKLPGCVYPYKMLAGVGVAFKLAQALYRSGFRYEFSARDLLDVVALGTVTDVAPLDGENRVLVRHGLTALNKTVRPGLKALMLASRARLPLDSRSIGFTLGPRINAAGRIDDAVLAYELLLAEDDVKAYKLAARLCSINEQRQQLTKEVQQRAQELAIASRKERKRLIVLDGEEFPAGIVGLVAARLVETFGRPVLLIERGEQLSRGSARSIAGFSIIDALTESGELFEKFGGHARAAGFSIRNDRIAELEQRLLAIAERDLHDELLVSRLHYDADIALSAIHPDFVDQLALLEPFGEANPVPVWVAHRVRIVDAKTIGREQQHLKLRVTDGRAVHEAVWWRAAEQRHNVAGGAVVDIAFTVERDEFNGRERVQLVVKDVRN